MVLSLPQAIMSVMRTAMLLRRLGCASLPFGVSLLAIFCVMLEFLNTSLNATPLHALKEVQNCAGCHNAGRAQKPPLERRCTLDCQGCHIDPNGGGARNQWGYYYSQDQLNAFKFFTPQDPLQDTSRADIHIDTRYAEQEQAGKTRTFPMSSEITFRVRPFVKYLHLVYTNQLMGREGDEMFRLGLLGSRSYRERYALMIDNLPLNTYIRAYRGSPTYGVKRSNHTLWIRQRVGLDQFATTDAVELGLTPNVPFFRVSKMLGDPYKEPRERQIGTSYHAGVRGVTLGWHLNSSGWSTSSEQASIKMSAFGAGLNLSQLLIYGEQNTREVEYASEADQSLGYGVHPSSKISEYTVAFAGIPGIYLGAVQESLQDETLDRKRLNYFADFHLFPFFQFEFWKRHETGSNDIDDFLFIAHIYADL